MSATEEVLEQVPEAVVEDVAAAVAAYRHNPYVLVGVGLIAGSLGALGGYKLAQKRLRMYYKEIADAEIAEARDYYGRLHLKETPEKLLAMREGDEVDRLQSDAIQAHRRYLGEAEAPAETEEELMSDEERALHAKHGVPAQREEHEDEGPRTQPVRHHAFEGRRPVENDDFDFAVEELNRTGERPYVITHDEFYENEKDYEQTHLVYYQGDDILADERDQPIPDEEATVGNDNLTKFGYGSKDENIVFVRNERIEVDFEITRSFGKYSEEVMGIDRDDGDERSMKHSHGSGGVRRFRTRD